MPLFVRLMTTEEIGEFVNFTTWIALLVPVLTLSLDSSVPVAKLEFKEKINDYISSVLVLGTAVTAAIYLLSLFFGDALKSVLNFDSFQLHIMFIFMLTAPSLSMLQIKSRLDYKYKLSAALSLLSVVVSTLTALLAVVISEDKVKGRILGFYLPVIILDSVIYVFFLIRSRSVNRSYWKYGVLISAPLALHAIAGSVLNSFDKIMINSMVGDSETALYGVAYSGASLVQLLWYSLNQAWAPWAYEQMDKNNGEKLKKASRIYILLFSMIVLVFMLLAPELLWIIGGKTYSQALDVMPPVMCGFVYLLVYSLYVNIETLEKKTGYVAVGTVTAALVNIVLNYIFIPRFGYVAAAYTTLAGYILLFVMHFVFVRHIGKTYWYDSRYNFIFLFVFTLISLLMTFVYKITVLRYVIIAAAAILIITVLLKHKDELLKKLKHF